MGKADKGTADPFVTARWTGLASGGNVQTKSGDSIVREGDRSFQACIGEGLCEPLEDLAKLFPGITVNEVADIDAAR